jgi:hypothetical protein
MTQPWEFEEPQPQGDRFTAEMAKNRRLLLVPTEYVPHVRTQRGDVVDAIRINVVDLDNQGGPAVYMGALWFGGKLIQALKPKIGKLFLGYVSKQATGGGFESWVFTSLTQDQATSNMASQFLQANPTFMETCLGDVELAQRNRAQAPQQQGWPRQQQQQGWGQQQQQWPQPPQQPQSPQQPQPQWQNSGPAGQVRNQPQPPLPPPVTPPLPPVQLPPQTEADPWPAPSMPQGNGQPPPPPAQAPSSPAPVGGSVMDRLRAQRDQGQAQGPAQGDQPF